MGGDLLLADSAVAVSAFDLSKVWQCEIFMVPSIPNNIRMLPCQILQV